MPDETDVLEPAAEEVVAPEAPAEPEAPATEAPAAVAAPAAPEAAPLPFDPNAEYDLTVESSGCIFVEKLLEFAATCSTRKETQEQITASFAAQFPNVRVTTVGYHSNVKTTVVA